MMMRDQPSVCPRPSFFLVLIVSVLIAASPSTWADTWFVDASVGASGAGTNWATAFKTIQEGVDAAVTSDTVLVTNGLYNENGAVTPGYALTNRVCITNAITVRSMNGPDVTIIAGAPDTVGGSPSNGPAAIRGVFMTNGCLLAGFTITNGYTMGSGDLVFDRSGGGLLMTTNCVVTNCILMANDALERGGGAYLLRGGRLDNSTVATNVSYQAGGVFLDYGGELNNCVVQGNLGTYGGGVFANLGGTLNNCLLSTNRASNDGGGIECWLGGTLNNVTVVGNVSQSSGGGAYLMQGGVVNNSIFWGNDAWSSGDDISRWLGGMEVRYTCSSDGVTNGADGCITNDPRLVTGGISNHHLQSISPCINAGNNDYAPTNVTPYDLAGDPRIQWSTVDMGAYESPFDAGTFYALSVTSSWGSTVPPVGEHVYSDGAIITNSVLIPGPSGTTQYVCSAWVMTGNEPATGSSTSFVMTVTNNAMLTWLWTTNYYLTPSSGPNGGVDVVADWFANGEVVVINATGERYYSFYYWTGDYPVGSYNSNPLSLLMNAPKWVTAHFIEGMTTSSPIAVPYAWLGQFGLTNFEVDVMDDVDGDLQFTWEEYFAAETDPTNPASFFYTGVGQGSMILSWPSAEGEGRIYDVEQVQSLISGEWITNLVWRDLEPTPPMNVVTNQTSDMTNAFEFFRVRARMGGGD